MIRLSHLFPLIALLMLVACGERSKKNLPPATGLTGDMYLIMDSLQWEGPLGDVLDSLFRQEAEVLPRKERIFHVRWIDPRKLNFVLKGRRNLVYAVTLDQRTSGAAYLRGLFTPESIAQIKTDSALFVQTQEDVYARHQSVMFLFAKTEAELIQKVRQNGAQLTAYFDRTERVRQTQALYKAGELKGVNQWVQKNYGCSFRVPFGYQLVMSKSDFLWARQINPRDDKNVFIARTPYRSEKQFSRDSLIAFRNAVCRQYLFEDPDVPDSYLITEMNAPGKPVNVKPITFHNEYAVELRGLWRANNFSMGGPFQAIAVVDRSSNYLYYLEGFVFSPERDQRELMRELETILYSFRPGPVAAASAGQ
ncbi:MAG: DUF4837 family protein [Cyclobacteriaceae bacterium]|jgi:hypothetical protein